MKSQSPTVSLEVTIQPIKQTAIANVLLLVGLVIIIAFPHSKSVVLSYLGGVLISVSVAMNIWYLFQSSRKVPLQIQEDSLQAGKRAVSSNEMVRIQSISATRTFQFYVQTSRWNRLVLRTDKRSYDAVKAKVEDFARRHQLKYTNH